MCDMMLESYLRRQKMTRQHNAQAGERRIRRHPFKRRDVERAMKSAKAEGLEIGAVEVVTRDGTTIRVFGKAAGSNSDLDNWLRGKNACPPEGH
jgi:hypothetical protein